MKIQQEENIGKFEQVTLGFNSSVTKAIIKQVITRYRCRHIHAKGGQIIEAVTPENTQMFDSALVAVSDDAGKLRMTDFSEREWNFKPIGEGMFSVQTMSGVKVFDEYVDMPIGLYDKISSFVNGFAVVEKEEKLGIISKAGQEIVPIIYKNNSYETTNGIKVEQFEVLNGVIVAVGDDSIDVYSKHGETLYFADKNGYDTRNFSDSFSRRFITYLSRIESLRDIYNDLVIGPNKYEEAIKNRVNERIDASIVNLILSLGSIKKYEQFINELNMVISRQKDPIYKKVKSKKYKETLKSEIESWHGVDLC